MTPRQFAILLMRVFGVFFLLDAILTMTEIVPAFYGAVQDHVHYVAVTQQLIAEALCFKLFVNLCVAVAFLFFTRPLSKSFTKGLDSVEEE